MKQHFSKSQGFYATYISECSDTFATLSGIISSPNFPQNYSDNLDCTYTILQAPNSTIQLDFLHFEIETVNGCHYDKLQVRFD